MSYSTKYYSGGIGDASGNTFTVNLKKKDYSGGTFKITSNAGSTSPLTLNYRGGRDQVDSNIRGSECQFNFYALSTDNYDDLLESEYQDWQLEILKATGSTDIISGGTQLINDTSTGQAWLTSGSTAYNPFTTTTSTTTTSTTSTSTTSTTTLAPNTFSGFFYVTSNGNNFNLVNFTSLNNINLSQTTLPAFSSLHITGTTNSSIAAGVTTFSFTINGNVSAANINVTTNTIYLFDNTTLNAYNAVTTNNNTHTVTITITIPNVAGHSFTLSGNAVFSGG